MPEYSSPLRMPINTGDSGLLVKSEEYLAGCLYKNKIKEVSITVPVKQPTSDSCASRQFASWLFIFCQLAISGKAQKASAYTDISLPRMPPAASSAHSGDRLHKERGC